MHEMSSITFCDNVKESCGSLKTMDSGMFHQACEVLPSWQGRYMHDTDRRRVGRGLFIAKGAYLLQKEEAKQSKGEVSYMTLQKPKENMSKRTYKNACNAELSKQGQ